MDDLKEVNTSSNHINIEKSIKSLNNIKKIFSHISEKRKLGIIIYNKKLLNKLNVYIENYKKISGKYKTGGINGHGKEYLIDTNILIYEGQYLNKKRHGLGKEYSKNGVLLYEGEYLNGKRHGLGKEYSKDGELIFEGEYINGKYFNGKGFNIMECDVKGGKGKVKLYYQINPKLLKFEGEIINGEINGKGTEYDTNRNIIFIGEYKNGKKWNGKGYNNLDLELINGNGKYKQYYINRNLKSEGKYINGEINGIVKEYYENGNLKSKGEYINGEKRNGKEYYCGELMFEGEYINGEKRNGKEYYHGKLIFEGEYLNGKRWNGKAKEYNYCGELMFEGEYINGKKRNGKEYYHGKLIFEGEYLNGKRWNGKGKEYHYDELIFEGEYFNGKKLNKKKKK